MVATAKTPNEGPGIRNVSDGRVLQPVVGVIRPESEMPGRIRTSTFGFDLRDEADASPETGERLRRPTLTSAEHLPNDARKTDPDLAAVVAACPGLPEAIKAGIVAMVKAARS